MPELPELHGMAHVINLHANGRVYDKCTKSSVTKLPRVAAPKGRFTISAEARGKELMMTLHPEQTGKSVFILCNMGLTGFFEAAACHKSKHRHAHLSFCATDGTVLSFVDQMRFGSWQSLGKNEWPASRGPDPVKDHEQFRLGVVNAVAAQPLKFKSKPICQVLHDQSLFNGIGNYLRAEILCRAGVPPFAPAMDALGSVTVKTSSGKADLLTLCRDVPQEVLDMKLSKYQGQTPGRHTTSTEDLGSGNVSMGADSEQHQWKEWLRVYGHPDASWAVDKEGRRIWFRGPPGRLYAKFSQKGELQRRGKLAKRTGGTAVIAKKPAGVTQTSGRNKKPQKTIKRAMKSMLKRPSSRKTK